MNRAKKHRNRSLTKRLRRISPSKKRQVDTRMQIAVNLDETLKTKGWKRTQLADALGVDRSLITKWLSGSHNFTVDTLVQLSVVLEITLADLISEPQSSITKGNGREASSCSVSPNYQGSITINASQGQILFQDTGQYFSLSLDTTDNFELMKEANDSPTQSQKEEEMLAA